MSIGARRTRDGKGGDKSWSAVKYVESENKEGNVNPGATSNADTPQAEIPNIRIIGPRRSRGIQGLAPEGHTKEHYSLKAYHPREEMETEDEGSTFDCAEYKFDKPS